MARTKLTLKCDASKPPSDLKCGYCSFGHRHKNKKMVETMKPCYVCKTNHAVHVKCARQFYNYRKKKNETFEEKKFLSDKLKFYCFQCKTSTCAFCDKEHPIGTPQSYIAECSEGHWFVSTENCCASSLCKSTPKTPWLCPKHLSEQSKKNFFEKLRSSPEVIDKKVAPLVSNYVTTDPTQSSSIKALAPISKDCSVNASLEVKDHYHVVKMWHKSKRKANLSLLHHKPSLNIDRKRWEKGIKNIITDFELMMMPLTQEYNDPQAKAVLEQQIEIQKKVNTEFVDSFKEVQDEKQDVIPSSLLPFSLSVSAIRRLQCVKGKKAYLNDELIYAFNMVLQEREIRNTAVQEDRSPHIFLPTCMKQFLYPPEPKYPSTKMEDVFKKDWIQVSENRTMFFQDYHTWFESTAKGRLDVVFDYFKSNNIVSFILHVSTIMIQINGFHC